MLWYYYTVVVISADADALSAPFICGHRRRHSRSFTSSCLRARIQRNKFVVFRFNWKLRFHVIFGFAFWSWMRGFAGTRQHANVINDRASSSSSRVVFDLWTSPPLALSAAWTGRHRMGAGCHWFESICQPRTLKAKRDYFMRSVVPYFATADDWVGLSLIELDRCVLLPAVSSRKFKGNYIKNIRRVLRGGTVAGADGCLVKLYDTHLWESVTGFVLLM